MRLSFFLFSFLLLCLPSSKAQIAFYDNTTQVFGTQIHNSKFPIAVVDMNADLLDDVVILAEDNITIYRQLESGEFTSVYVANEVSEEPWSVCVADVDQNGYNDIFTGGNYTILKILKANADASDYDIVELDPSNIFLQGSNFSDIDNDGDVDLFTCHDLGLSPVWENDGVGNFSISSPLLINTASTVPSNNSGNYSSVWTDYDNDGDLDLYLSKCKDGIIDPLDGKRLNLLFQNNGENVFVDVAEAAGLRPQGQSWATDFADIDNDGDLDAVIVNHDIPTLLYKNIGNGTFEDFTEQSGLNEILTNYNEGFQCLFRDFDNDGYVDLLLSGQFFDNHYLLHNNGDFSFSEVSAAFPTAPATLRSFAIGDLNQDGFLDICSSFNDDTNDVIWFNAGNNTNNHIGFVLQGNESNINGIGARVELYGEWGKQIREVRSGESYGIMNSYQVHFGIGTASVVDSLIVRWPSGTVDKQDIQFNINQTNLLEEGNFPSGLSPIPPDENRLIVFPNPTSDFININGEARLDLLQIHNTTGKLIFQQNKLPNNYDLNLSTLPNGIYYLTINTTGGIHHLPIVKMD